MKTYTQTIATIILLLVCGRSHAAGYNRVEIRPDTPPTCTTGYGCVYVSNVDNLWYSRDAAGLLLKLHAAKSFRSSSNCAGLSSPALGDVCFDSSLTAFRYYTGSWVTATVDDSLVVHKAGTETITGAKTFTAAAVFNDAVTLGDAAADIISNKGTFRLYNSAGSFYSSITTGATANRSVTIPDAAGEVIIGAATQTISGPKTFTGTLTMSGATIAMGSQKITGLATPTTSTDAATKGYVDAAAPELFFSRTCTLTSAAAVMAVNCLADADVAASKRAYLLGWHAKVNGATAWATTATCWIQDTSGTSNHFITMAVAALTGNAFIADHSANVTQDAPYSRNQGGTLDLGLEVACDANGTGSDLVVTVFGVIK